MLSALTLLPTPAAGSYAEASAHATHDSIIEDSLSRQCKSNGHSDEVLQVSCTARQIEAVEGLLYRLIPEHAHLFDLRLVHSGGSSGSLFVEDGFVHIEGSSGVELASAIHWFIKYFCCSSFSWRATGGLQLDTECFSAAKLQEFESRGKVTIERSVPYSFYQNVVTMSYSMAYWDWQRWEQEIDWMALQGINLPLAPVGIEYAWVKTYEEYNISASELEDFFPGPSFLAWGRMGNIQGYGGPLPFSYINSQYLLQKQIVARMRSFGMAPVLPAFAGFVPRALVAKFPTAKVTKISNWCHFPDHYCCPFLLDPSDPLFQELGSKFIRNLRAMYGWDAKGYYIADTFNEMRPTCSDPSYLSGISKSVYQGMADADPSATWLMQAWLFFSDQLFWQPPQIQALLSGVPKGNLILLDLFAEEHPIWERTNSFFGYPFIWCMLHNFGGNLEIYGALPSVVDGVSRALKSGSTIVGVGMAPEGIEQNPAVYELMSEMALRQRVDVNLHEWFALFAQRRYGGARDDSAVQAWSILCSSSYNCFDRQHNTVADIPTSRPGLARSEITGWGLRPHCWYNLADLVLAWRRLLEAAARLAPGAALAYDVVDVAREALSKLSTRRWDGIVNAYMSHDAAALDREGGALLAMLDDMDLLLSSHPSFLLGPFLKRAIAASTCPGEAALYEWNARTQVTIWGTSDHAGDSEVSDYANKEWAGLLSSFYRPRWQAWIARLQEDLALGRPYGREEWRLQCLRMVAEWTHRTDQFPTAASGDPLALSKIMFQKYGAPLLEEAGQEATCMLEC